MSLHFQESLPIILMILFSSTITGSETFKQNKFKNFSRIHVALIRFSHTMEPHGVRPHRGDASIKPRNHLIQISF